MSSGGDGIDEREAKRRRDRRSVAIALAIAGLAVLFYLITIVRMGPAVLQRPL